jgi:hypothetical protein
MDDTNTLSGVCGHELIPQPLALPAAVLTVRSSAPTALVQVY